MENDTGLAEKYRTSGCQNGVTYEYYRIIVFFEKQTREFPNLTIEFHTCFQWRQVWFILIYEIIIAERVRSMSGWNGMPR